MNSSEIAKLAHVSRTTVSRVLNGHANVSDATRRRVEAVIRQHNYFPDAAARNLVGKQSKVLGLFIIDLAANHDAYTISRSQFFYDYIAYAIDITNRHGYNLLTTIVHADNMDDVDRLFQSRSISGGILMGDHLDRHNGRRIRQGVCIGGDIGLDGVGQGIHAGGRREDRGHPLHQLRVVDGDLRGDPFQPLRLPV